MPLKIKKCPFCGKTPKVTPYPNNLGYNVECVNEECEMWGHKFDLDGWNNRKNTIKDIIQYLFSSELIFQSANFKKALRYVCNYCGAEGRHKKDVKHKAGCKIGNFLQNAS